MRGDEGAVHGNKRWPLLAALGGVLLIFMLGVTWFCAALAHGMSHAVVAHSSPMPDPPEPALTIAPVADVSTVTAATPAPFARRPVRTVAALFVPPQPKPSTACCSTVSYRSAQSQQSAPPRTPAPVIVHKLENLDFGNTAPPNVGTAPQPIASIPSNYALPTSAPSAQSRYVIPSQYEISDTDFVRVKLETEVQSEVPGEVVGVITRPIMDSATHSVELIPAGSTIHGDDDHSNLAQGQGRLGIDWYEIILPNTISIPLGKQKSADVMGAGGIAGNVDSHQGRAFGKFVMYTLVGALGNAIGRVSYLGGSSIGSQFAGSAQEIKPTITIPANTDIDIYLSGPISDLRPWSDVKTWHQ
jgi:type IV secretory pathway VirB10-like protein